MPALPEVLRYDGEYGHEILCFTPYIYQLHREGKLHGHKVSTYAGMEPYYYFLPSTQLILRTESRPTLPYEHRWWPDKNEFHRRAQPGDYPDYKGQYANSDYKWAKPTLFVSNKVQVEWDRGPLNYIPLRTLREIFELLMPHFQIVYSRPGIVKKQEGYMEDINTFCEYPDRGLLQEFPDVYVLEELAAGQNYNEVKLKVLSNTSEAISIQGGGNYLLAMYPGMNLTIYHTLGEEYDHWCYWLGYYKHCVRPAPRLRIATTWDELERCVDLITLSRTAPGRYQVLSLAYSAYEITRRILWLECLDYLRHRVLKFITRKAGGVSNPHARERDKQRAESIKNYKRPTA